MQNITEVCDQVVTGVYSHFPNAQRVPNSTRHEIHGIVFEVDAENDPAFTATANDDEIIFHAGDYKPEEIVDQIVAFITKHRTN